MIRAPDDDAIRSAIDLLQSGELVGIPTETVYGLGGIATSQRAVDKIFRIKGRPSSNPLIVHIASTEQLNQCAVIERGTTWAGRLEKLLPLWPGPLSILLPKSPNLPAEVTAGGPLVAVRIPSHPVTLELLSRLQAPIAAPSANISGYVSPTTAQHVEDGFGPQLRLILDGGPCASGIESTVVSLLEPSPRILRPGAVTIDVLESLLGEPVVAATTIPETQSSHVERFESPGTMTSHYAPSTPVYFKHDFRPNLFAGQRIGVLWFSSEPPDFPYHRIEWVSKSRDPLEVAPRLYSALRELDSLDCDCIVVDTCRTSGLGVAVMDRLRRATMKIA